MKRIVVSNESLATLRGAMFGICRVYSLVVLLLLFVQLDVFVAGMVTPELMSDAVARSFRQPPVSVATTVKDARILSWQRDPSIVHCTSTFTLVFSVEFQGEQRSQIRLSLEPNHHLFPEDATVEYINDEGHTVRTEPIVRQDHKVYKGEAYFKDELTKQWTSCGWTRIMVLRDGADPLFEGVFLKDRDVHHVKLLSKYNSQKDLRDLEFADEDPDNTMVVYRDSDRFLSQSTLLARSVDGTVSSEDANTTICAHDRLAFNMQSKEQGPWTLGKDIFGRLVRRQSSDVGGSLATGGSRSQLAATVGDTTGCQTTRRVALVAAAADCSYVTKYGNASATRAQIISIYNQVCRTLAVAYNRLPLYMRINSISRLD